MIKKQLKKYWIYRGVLILASSLAQTAWSKPTLCLGDSVFAASMAEVVGNEVEKVSTNCQIDLPKMIEKLPEGGLADPLNGLWLARHVHKQLLQRGANPLIVDANFEKWFGIWQEKMLGKNLSGKYTPEEWQELGKLLAFGTMSEYLHVQSELIDAGGWADALMPFYAHEGADGDAALHYMAKRFGIHVPLTQKNPASESTRLSYFDWMEQNIQNLLGNLRTQREQTLQSQRQTPQIAQNFQAKN